ncbi:MATE family efflux transporter [Anaerofustis stercorihominis]|uniref:MATE family efflux transporter n=1 Tax=Anaerofustis stercorihominis TaxID=214853 RepID=UPI00214CAFEF|nr:MATE family efflux transporter [Anaerofustis stercorihominis]MCR2033475.1 MATE family efflux transporter [Anaerofustis stercorihominis]
MSNENMTNSRENILSRDFDLSSLLKFAFPTIIMMIFMGLYTIIDTIFVSRFVNTNALSSINIVCPIINIVVGIGTMIATGSSAIIASKMGEGDYKEAREYLSLIVIFGITIGIIISILGIIFIDKIIWSLGASEILYSYCKDYLLIILIFTPAGILQVLFQSLIVTAGRPGFGMILSISAGMMNMILDYIFIVIFNMGIKGSALGTGIGYVLPSVIGIIFFLTSKGTLYFEKPKFDINMIFKSLYNGSSEMVSQLATAITTFLFNLVMMKLLGENGVAAITIIIYSQFMLSTLFIGFSMGVSPIMSFNYGSKNHNRLKTLIKSSITFIGFISILVFMISMFFGDRLVSVFSPAGSEVYDIARNGFFIFPISFLFCGFNIFSSAIFTALSNGKVSAMISFLRTFCFITIGLLTLPILFGVNGVWLAVPLSEFITMFISIYFIKTI